jgi:thiosulfate dehydrogenase
MRSGQRCRIRRDALRAIILRAKTTICRAGPSRMPPLIGIWGQFPQYRAREGAVDTLEDRIDGRMERSLNGLALPPGGREMRALSSYLRWLSTGVPDGAKLVGAGTLKIKEPSRAANPGHGAEVFSRLCAACHGPDGSGQRAQAGAGYQFPPLWGPDSYNNGAGMSRL